jgi:hypothetical protein
MPRQVADMLLALLGSDGLSALIAADRRAVGTGRSREMHQFKISSLYREMRTRGGCSLLSERETVGEQKWKEKVRQHGIAMEEPA